MDGPPGGGPGSAVPDTTWYLGDARPDGITEHGSTAADHETRIARLAPHAATISPGMPR
ncbi:hypothetical protein ABZY44_30915 [Streptomyces sp. NPDC006544]|uniref:hypothetical protein n=1 Tax=Streptomyces sp. NPDC006544 TaxID=3154583 RepID=UPI0033B748AA